MDTPTFSLAYTSVRPLIIPRVAQIWRDRARDKEFELVISVDEGSAECLLSANMVQAAFPATKVAVNTGPRTSTAGWNAAAAATTGKIIICVADDFMPPHDWDRLLLELEPKGWKDGEHVVHVDDGYVQNIFVLSILTRKRYQRFGYVFYPKYLSLFSDTEFGEVALRDGVVIEAMHLLFEHMHPDCRKRERDASDGVHASPERWTAGEQLFNFRRSQGFPLDDGPNAVAPVKSEAPVLTGKENEYVVYMQLTRNDFCLEEVVERLFEEGIKIFFWAEPDEYWSGEPIEPLYLHELDEAAQNLKAKLGDKITIVRKRFDVKAARMPGDTRISVETRIRNDSLDWVRAQGYQHLLIVDGDELWLRGTLELVKKYVEQGHPAVNTHMVPAIGLPSYPVDRATDTAVVYIGKGQTFKTCRSPHCRSVIVPVPRIIHFTGTRRSLEETVAKHRRGGHYDDPDYDFETWLKDVLPNVRPGFNYKWPNGQTGLHMYKKWQIWSAIREWRSEELVEIPISLHKYLGGLEGRQEVSGDLVQTQK